MHSLNRQPGLTFALPGCPWPALFYEFATVMPPAPLRITNIWQEHAKQEWIFSVLVPKPSNHGELEQLFGWVSKDHMMVYKCLLQGLVSAAACVGLHGPQSTCTSIPSLSLWETQVAMVSHSQYCFHGNIDLYSESLWAFPACWGLLLFCYHECNDHSTSCYKRVELYIYVWM